MIRGQLNKAPLFVTVLAEIKREVDADISSGIFVPVPKDMAGGYTHERHKKNFFILQKAGNLFQITGDEKYAQYVRDVFAEYAKLFPSLELHPTNRSYATGKIFWQCLNDANWLVYCSQAYDCIYDWLPQADRENFEQNLFRPLADFLSVENPQFFNRIHNHSTWANAAVGMIGLVMDDEELIERALFGLQDAHIDPTQIDNDGGYIKQEGQVKAGFLAQLDESFSPDGYFTEGPYYLRYAMTPFILFANALNQSRPDLKIFSYRDRILEKSVTALLNQTDWQGRFFPINDAQKGMSWHSREVISAVDIAYAYFGNDPMLLSIATTQNKVDLNEAGFIVARDIHSGLAQPYHRETSIYRDGPLGDKGGVGIVRNRFDHGELCTVFKYSAHGMGHGHFDKLSYSLYDDTGEVVQDYGAARWVNIDQKGGGRYLKENNSWAKQTIAHNTLVVNGRTQYDGSVKTAEQYSPDLDFFDQTNHGFQAISASDHNAYPGVKLQRVIAQLTDDQLGYPLHIDVFRVESETENQYDMPLWFQGQLLETNFTYQQVEKLEPMGDDDGYQHLWTEAVGTVNESNAKMTWFENNRFYTSTMLVEEGDECMLLRLGANDPEFNLRRDPCLLMRKSGSKDALFIAVVEPHGNYSPVSEIPIQPYPEVSEIVLEKSTRTHTVFVIKLKEGESYRIMIAHHNTAEEAVHQVEIESGQLNWVGPTEMIKI